MVSRILAGTSLVVFAVLSVLEIGWESGTVAERLDAPEILPESLPDVRKESVPPFVVMTYNVRLDVPLVPGPSWAERRDHVIRLVQEVDPDLLLVLLVGQLL